MRTTLFTRIGFSVVAAMCAATANANEITDWNAVLFRAALAAGTTPLAMTRVGAIVQASVFDAVNGIERRYTPIHVTADAPRGASKRAAAVEAAYAALYQIYPDAASRAIFDSQRALSLAMIASGPASENSESIQRGIEWGDTVAAAILSWRSTDGIAPAPPPFFGVNAIGVWRSTPPAFLPFAGLQFATMRPWMISSPSQFRPAGPPALSSAQYAVDFNETKAWGSLTSAVRTADQTTYSLFWNASTAPFYWNQIAIELADAHHLTFSELSRLLGMVNVAMADAAIGCWDAKLHYLFWRPITAIREPTDTAINPATAPDPAWLPLFATPAHPDYPSGHSCVSGAAARVLSSSLGDGTPFSVTSDVMTTVTRNFSSLTAATDEIRNARVFAGIHFRTATNDGQALGVAVAEYIAAHGLLPANGNKTGQIGH
ncbi:MAG TPA: vanadium-dependent haloperoxidase [Bryobacteraceae bacterium]